MEIIGAGLSKTGTKSLSRALTTLGLRTMHNDMQRLSDVLTGTADSPDFRRYDDVDAVVDLPSAWFFEELLQAYPHAKVILTVRDEDAWWQSIRIHMGDTFGMVSREQDPLRWDMRCHVYGSAHPQEFLYRKRYREHNARVQAVVPADRLLVMNVTAGDGWEPLCGFLGLPTPREPFPHGNDRASLAQMVEARRQAAKAQHSRHHSILRRLIAARLWPGRQRKDGSPEPRH